MASSNGPAISVVIPTYKRPQLLEQCLVSLFEQDLPASDFEIIVVDDASGPETVAVLERHATAPNLRWESQPTNRGPAAARNQAVAMATGSLLLFMDDDIVASPSLLRTHVEWHAGKPDTVGLVGLVRWLPTLRITRFMAWLESFPLQFGFDQMQEGRQDNPTGTFYTCNLSMKPRLFREIGGFNERFPFANYEDTELATRLVDNGFELHYRKDALVWNSRAVTLDEFCARMSRMAQSALILQAALPDEDPIIKDLVHSRYSTPAMVALRLLGTVTPRFFGREPRTAYYLERISRAYQRGLALGPPASK